MKISVLGAGAIGSTLGGLLQHDAPDLDVVLIVRGEHGRVLERRGSLLIDGPWGTREVRVRVENAETVTEQNDVNSTTEYARWIEQIGVLTTRQSRVARMSHLPRVREPRFDQMTVARRAEPSAAEFKSPRSTTGLRV